MFGRRIDRIRLVRNLDEWFVIPIIPRDRWERIAQRFHEISVIPVPLDLSSLIMTDREDVRDGGWYLARAMEMIARDRGRTDIPHPMFSTGAHTDGLTPVIEARLMMTNRPGWDAVARALLRLEDVSPQGA